jgi:hypothetical protein
MGAQQSAWRAGYFLARNGKTPLNTKTGGGD